MTDTSITLNASSRIMYQAAQEMGISCMLFDDHETILMKKDGRQWYTRGSRTSLQSSVGKTISDQKPLTKKILEYFHLPTAKGVRVRNEQELSLLSELRFPLVMKPISERHGKGVIVGIRSLSEAAEAFASANQTVLFEEMLKGTEYRIVCVNFQFVAAAFRQPAHVIGDGEHTIQQLIDQKNQHPWRGKGHVNNLSLIEVDELVTQYLKDQQLTLTSIPSPGQEVFLRKTANLSTGGEAWDVTDQVSPANRQLFEEIARACDLNVVGIDMMCQSLAMPIREQAQSGVIEVNASPGLRMHHFPLQGTPRNVAQMILKFVIENLPNNDSSKSTSEHS